VSEYTRLRVRHQSLSNTVNCTEGEERHRSVATLGEKIAAFTAQEAGDDHIVACGGYAMASSPLRCSLKETQERYMNGVSTRQQHSNCAQVRDRSAAMWPGQVASASTDDCPGRSLAYCIERQYIDAMMNEFNERRAGRRCCFVKRYHKVLNAVCLTGHMGRERNISLLQRGTECDCAIWDDEDGTPQICL